VYRRILDQVQHAPPLRRKIFHWAVGVGRQAIPYVNEGRPVPRTIAWRHRLADRLVYRQIRAVLGGQMKFFVSGGAPLAADIGEFFSAIGVTVLEGWGATESSAPATLNRPGQIRIGSVGRPLPGIEVRLLDDGELLIRGPSVCLGYWKMPVQSAETFDPDGWYHTGDIGRIDRDGYVYITDRKKELIITAAGKNISPQNIENKLKLSPYIANALAFGDRQPYVTALVTLDAEAVAKIIGAADASPAMFAKSAAVQHLIGEEVARVNEDLPRFEQIKKFRILPADFTVEADELSPSLKLKRKNVVAHYRTLIDSMYAEND
jgi:long-chain acyl-CoA synthetase